MNVKYTDINCQDAAKSIGVSTATIQGWCRGKLINFVDIGDGNKKPRYMISEQEVNYLRSLVKSHGKRKALLFYDKDFNMKGEESEMEICDVPAMEVEEVPTRKIFKKDEIVTTISYIQDIKERLEDIEAERNQLLNELEDLKKEVIGML